MDALIRKLNPSRFPGMTSITGTLAGGLDGFSAVAVIGAAMDQNAGSAFQNLIPAYHPEIRMPDRHS